MSKLNDISHKISLPLKQPYIQHDDWIVVSKEELKALMLEAYKEARNRYNSQYGVGQKYNQIHFFEEVLREL